MTLTYSKGTIARAAVESTPAVALCGKQWVPTRDGEKFPVCPDCKDILENVVESNVPGGN